MSMKLVLENPILFKKSIDIISELVLEGTIVIKPNYIELVALSQNNVVMVIFRLLSTNFEEYNIEKEEYLSLNFEHLNDVLKRCPDNEKLILSKEDNKFKLEPSGKNSKVFELSLIEFVDENLQKVPDLNFDVNIKTKARHLSEAINDLSFIEEGIDFIIDSNKFIIEGKTPTRAGRIELKEDTEIESKVESCKSRYHIGYLKKFIKGEKIVNNVEISFSNDYPLKIEYKVIDRLLLGFILAPRGDSD